MLQQSGSWLGAFSLVPLVGVMSTFFGGEDPLGGAPDGDNWHHEGITRKAARAAGWSPEAENALAFHADYVDSYLYNPLWWLDFVNGGGADRLKVVLSSQADLVKVHFDDLFDPESVHATWRRYLSGTAAALLWVASRDVDRRTRTSMAHNAVGVSLHALQDFWSHSNWIDEPARRDCTWFEMDPSLRRDQSLWTGSYELPDHLGIKPHGAFELACTILNNVGGAGRALLRLVCHAASPLSGTSLCGWFKRCQEAEPLAPPDIVGLEPPEGVLWVKPGINVDSRWQAPMGVDVRGIDLSGPEAFRLAYELAYRTSCQWLHLLDHVMDDAGLSQFWEEVKTSGVATDQYKSDVAPWEQMDRIPYRFLTAGPYPPERNVDDERTWYLRLTVATADEDDAGTDADIVPFVDGQRFPPLDHGPKPTPPEPGEPPERTLTDTALGVNDHERGGRAAYIIGPLDTPPTSVTLLNDAPDTLDVIAAAGEALLDAVVGIFESIGGFFLGLIGYHADFVDSNHHVVSADDLEGLAPGASRSFSIRCDGGSEGRYDVLGSVRATSLTGTDGLGIPWREYEVRFDTLRCDKESEWDRFSDSDEPFVLGLVLPHGGGAAPIPWRTSPYSDVDTGESRSINRDFSVRIPRRHGFLSLAVAVYESDDESGSDRDDLLDEFAGTVEAHTQEPEDSFLVTLGAAIAAGWKVADVEAVAFRRGREAEVIWYAPEYFDRWLDGGEEVRWDLRESRRAAVAVPDRADACGCPPDKRPPATVAAEGQTSA